MSNFSTLDHKKIAMMFLGWTMGMFLFGGIFAGYFKFMSYSGKGVDQATLDQMLTYHGIIMVFMFLIPLIPSVLGYFLLPLQLVRLSYFFYYQIQRLQYLLRG